MSQTLSKTSEYLLDVTDEDDQPYIARVTVTSIAADGLIAVFLTEDERVIVYDAEYNDGEFWIVEGDRATHWGRRVTSPPRKTTMVCSSCCERFETYYARAGTGQ